VDRGARDRVPVEERGQWLGGGRAAAHLLCKQILNGDCAQCAKRAVKKIAITIF
jgi:hypothetical protein